MPTSYAHYRFGKSVFRTLNQEQKACVEAYPDLYHIGLHGPDLLFYYKALQRHPVNRTGFATHEKKGKDVFASAASVVKKMEAESGERGAAARAYLYGYLCHFALDSSCHPYVEAMTRETGLSHSLIEAELDRCLMEKDGRDPMRFRPTGHLYVKDGERRRFYGEIIAPFFPGISAEDAEKSIRSIFFYCNLLAPRGPLARRIQLYLMRLVRCSESIQDMVIRVEREPACAALNRQLTLRYQKAVSDGAELISNVDGYLDGTTELDPRFEHTFGEF